MIFREARARREVKRVLRRLGVTDWTVTSEHGDGYVVVRVTVPELTAAIRRGLTEATAAARCNYLNGGHGAKGGR